MTSHKQTQAAKALIRFTAHSYMRAYVEGSPTEFSGALLLSRQDGVYAAVVLLVQESFFHFHFHTKVSHTQRFSRASKTREWTTSALPWQRALVLKMDAAWGCHFEWQVRFPPLKCSAKLSLATQSREISREGRKPRERGGVTRRG